MWLFAARWVQQGSPTIILDDQLAASLMATNVGVESVEHIRPPWKAFVIEIPPGLLDYEFGGERRSFQLIMVHHVQGSSGSKWVYWAKELDDATRDGSPGIVSTTTTEKMILEGWDDMENAVNEQHTRAGYLVGRLILSLCLALSDPTTTTLRERKRSKGRGNRFRTANSIPDPRNFVMGRSITVDCRPAIRDFIAGTKEMGSINVQTLVRGHWKHQVHGVGRALRKLVHIEPYWKGPEEAKILIRPTKVEG